MKYLDLAKELVENARGFLADKDVYYGARARVLAEIEEFEEASEVANKSVEEVKKLIPIKGLMGNFSVYSLQVGVLLLAGDYPKAFEKSLSLYKEIKEVQKGTPHYFTASTLNMLAKAALELNKVDFAEENIRESLKILSELYGGEEKTRHHATAHTVLGDIYLAKREYDNARVEYLKAEDIYNITLKNKKLHAVGALYAKIAVNGTRMKDSVITSLYLTKLKNIFGDNHLYIREVMNCLHEHRLEP